MSWCVFLLFSCSWPHFRSEGFCSCVSTTETIPAGYTPQKSFPYRINHLSFPFFQFSLKEKGILLKQLLRPELVKNFRVPLSSGLFHPPSRVHSLNQTQCHYFVEDAFTVWGRADVNNPTHNAEVAAATEHLFNVRCILYYILTFRLSWSPFVFFMITLQDVIPKVAQRLSTLSDDHARKADNYLEAYLHHAGVNLRHLGMRQAVTEWIWNHFPPHTDRSSAQIGYIMSSAWRHSRWGNTLWISIYSLLDHAFFFFFLLNQMLLRLFRKEIQKACRTAVLQSNILAEEVCSSWNGKHGQRGLNLLIH